MVEVAVSPFVAGEQVTLPASTVSRLLSVIVNVSPPLRKVSFANMAALVVCFNHNIPPSDTIANPTLAQPARIGRRSPVLRLRIMNREVVDGC